MHHGAQLIAAQRTLLARNLDAGHLQQGIGDGVDEPDQRIEGIHQQLEDQRAGEGDTLRVEGG